MQINRLFEIVMMLLSKDTVTAKELADRFGVSTRTIYRDIDTLSLCNIPVYTNKGNGGGISILSEFILDKSLLSEREQRDIIAAVQGLKCANYPEIDSVITKLGAIFKNCNNNNWIEIDFSQWGSNVEEKDKFTKVKASIIKHNIINFEYISSTGEKTRREVEPLKLVFKGHAWYLQAFCRTRNDNRTFKISRISDLVVCDEVFEPSCLECRPIEPVSFDTMDFVSLKLKFQPKAAIAVYDGIGYENVKQNDDGTVEATKSFPKGDWVYGYILSFGQLVEVLEPEDIRKEVKSRLHKILKVYC